MATKIDPKTLHVVAYVKRADGPLEVMGQGEVEKARPLVMQNGRLWPGALHTQIGKNGRVEVLDGEQRLGSFAPGKALTVKQDGVELKLEAREIVLEPGDTKTDKLISPLALRVFQRQLAKQSELDSARESLKADLDQWENEVAAHRQRLDTGSTHFRATLAKLSFFERIDETLTERLGKLDALASKARKQAESALTRAQSQRVEAARGALSASLVEIEALAKLKVSRQTDDYFVGLLQVEERHRAIVERADARYPAAAMEALQREIDKLVEGNVGWFAGHEDDSTTNRAHDILDSLDSPKWLVSGRATIAAIRQDDELTHWTVRFENQGEQAFVGTVVMLEGGKNDGIGFESMGLPNKGDAAEQTIVVNGHYGARALPGSEIRLGVRSLGWQSVKLPENGTTVVDLGTLTIEDDGANRPEDFDAALIDRKRQEKYYTGKVRFLAGKKPWSPQ